MLQSFKLALKSIWGNKMRSFLTMLGIIIGVAAVIILVSLVNGYMGSVVESFASMGVNQINVNVTNLASRSLDVDQMYAFYEEHTDLFGELSPNVTLSSTIKYGDDSMTSTSVAGRSEQYLEIKSYELETGRNIAYSDIVSRQKVCVIGAYVANELYGSSQNAIGRTLKIDGYAFKIIGVAEAQDADNMEDGGTDDFVWIPYSVAVKMSRNANITNYTFTALDTSKADECTAVIKNFLYETFKDEDLYRVTAMSEMLDSLNEQIAMMSGMLGGIAGISLLVAGVGVMNIMLVSVTERTQEIGLKKAIGARKSKILNQFLTEAAVLTSLGGVLGVIVGIILAEIISYVTTMPVAISIPAAIGSVLFSMVIGIVFGVFPSYKAANLNPIDALRHE